MKILLTGASGLVGSAFARAAHRQGHSVTGIVGRFAGTLEGVTHQQAVDLTDEGLVERAVRDAAPDAIVNCAAISEPAACDVDPLTSEKMNVALPATLARLSSAVHATLIHVSSEQVFDGQRTAPYSPDDAPAPINRYGRQKLAGEQAVRASAASSAIVRAPLLMGDSPGGKRGLHERLLADWAAGRTARLYVDEFRQPCTAENLAAVLLELVSRSDLRGVFHWAGRELVSRFELGQRVRAHFRLAGEDAPIAAVSRAEHPTVAATRQPCLALDLAPLAGGLKTPVQSVDEQLATLRVPPPVRAWHAARTGRDG